MIKLIVNMGVCIQKQVIPLGSLKEEEALRCCGVDAQTSLLVGLSGGPDSVALLLWCHSLLERKKIAALAACHVHHGIRGTEADRDAAFCKDLCLRFEIPLETRYRDVPALAQRQACSLETAAREARYGALEEARQKLGMDRIAVAHHRGDQAETVLMHLIRGSGLKGLLGMDYRNGRIIRPLLSVSREEILDYLATQKEPYCTDETNLEPVHTRSRIRLQVMPLLEQITPGAEAAIAGLARRLRPDEAALEQQAEAALESLRCQGGLNAAGLANLPHAIQIRVLGAFFRESGRSDITERELLATQELLIRHNGARTQLQGGYFAHLDGGILRIESVREQRAPQGCWPLVPGARVETPFGTFETRWMDKPSLPAGRYEAYLDGGALPENLCIRTRRAGDRFYPLGAPGDRSLSDYYTDRKATGRIRSLPLLAAGNRIYWATGCTITELAKVGPSTKQILYIQFQEGEDHG